MFHSKRRHRIHIRCLQFLFLLTICTRICLCPTLSTVTKETTETWPEYSRHGSEPWKSQKNCDCQGSNPRLSDCCTGSLALKPLGHTVASNLFISENKIIIYKYYKYGESEFNFGEGAWETATRTKEGRRRADYPRRVTYWHTDILTNWHTSEANKKRVKIKFEEFPRVFVDLIIRSWLS